MKEFKGFEWDQFVVIGLLTIGTIFVQVVLLSMGSYLCCFEGEHLLLFKSKRVF